MLWLFILVNRWNMPFHYFPRGRPIPRPEAPFPFLSTREDWPFSREEVGGWILTPFGGRGRFRDEIIELEGIVSRASSIIPLVPADHEHSSVFRRQESIPQVRPLDTAYYSGAQTPKHYLL
jgi:hypothetical protein